MGATDIAPTRLAAAQASARRFLADLPEKYRVAVVAFSSQAQVVSRRRRVTASSWTRRSARSASARRPRSATRSRPRSQVAGGRPQGEPQPGQGAAARRRSSSSRTVRVDGGRVDACPTAIRRARDREGTRLHGGARHRDGRRRRCRMSAATSSGSRCRRIPTRFAAWPTQTGGSFFEAPTEDDLGAVYDDLEVAPRQHPQGRGDHVRIRGGAAPAPSRRGRASRCSGSGGCREIRSLVTVLAVTAALTAGVSSQPRSGRVQRASGLHPRRRAVGRDAGRDGASAIARRGELMCPEGVVGGVDARVSDQRVAVEFSGPARQPGQSGDHDDRSLVFSGTYTGAPRKATSFRPFIGCIPGGGGGRRTPTARSAAPGQARTSRSRRASRRSGSSPATLARDDARLPPRRAAAAREPQPSGSTRRRCRRAAELAVGARRAQSCAMGRSSSARPAAGSPRDVRAEVQVHAECAR